MNRPTRVARKKTIGPAARPLSFAAEAMGADRSPPTSGTGATARVRFAGAATDSRAVSPGNLFFAVRGERVDGFDFAAEAAKRGACAVVVPRGRGRPRGCESVFVLEVDDPVRALGALAAAVRADFRGRVVGVTGSNGKTTTKEMIATALESAGAVLRTPGNLNTDIGLPLVVLSATGREDFWVLEMAMRGPGEIATLAEIALPHVAVVTNIAAAHVGRLGSIEAVAAAKSEIFSRLDRVNPIGLAVAPAHEPLLDKHLRDLPPDRVLRFAAAGIANPAQDAQVRVLDAMPSGAEGVFARVAVAGLPVVIHLPLAGVHNATNAAAALAVVHALGVSVVPAAENLSQVRLPPHRSQPIEVGGRVILDDCYNANPASMRAALQTISDSTGARAFAILGDMLELGDDAERLHADIGASAARLGLAGLAAVGDLGRHIADGARAAGLPAERVVAGADPGAAARTIAAWTQPGDWILVKASRGARLERAIEALQDLWRSPAAADHVSHQGGRGS